MGQSEPGLEQRIFGGRWAVAERSPKPAWVQIEEQLGDRIESGALQDPEVLGDRRLRNPGLRRQRSHRLLALAAQPLEDGPPRGVGESPKERIVRNRHV